MSDSVLLYGLEPTRLFCPRDSPGKSTGVGCHALLLGDFPNQGSNPDLLHCRQILYHWTTREAHMVLIHYYLLKSIVFIRISLICLMFFLCYGLIQDTNTKYSQCISLGSSWIWQFLKLSLFLITYSLKDYRSSVIKTPSFGIWMMLFAWLYWSLWFGEEDHRSKLSFSSHYIKGMQ